MCMLNVETHDLLASVPTGSSLCLPALYGFYFHFSLPPLPFNIPAQPACATGLLQGAQILRLTLPSPCLQHFEETLVIKLQVGLNQHCCTDFRDAKLEAGNLVSYIPAEPPSVLRSSLETLFPLAWLWKASLKFSALIHPELSWLSPQAFGEQGIMQVLPTTRTGPNQWTLNHLTYATYSPVHAKTCPRSLTGTTIHTALCCAEGHR